MPKQKVSHGSVRAKAGLPAKAGRRRPPHLACVYEKDKYGIERRNYVAVAKAKVMPKSKKKKNKAVEEVTE